MDALLPTLDRMVATNAPELWRFRGLGSRVSPQVRALLGLAARAPRVAPAESLRQLFGDDVPRRVEVQLSVVSVGEGTPCVKLSLSINSDRSPFFDVRLSEGGRRTSFDSETETEDELGIGFASFGEIPAYAARVAGELGIAWDWERVTALTNLVLSQRTRVITWLRGLDCAP